ncbi:hypothetical protein DPX16_1569 [Anabarilius grahami]|uniref:Uncharacterized protein n=1 Tax=Anabarilius grahami TaxID=495550 RepID=A0A3N0Z8K0_ANAGA|nr:hypothetical protein DPX16_1569 [Anabarilius grahami]
MDGVSPSAGVRGCRFRVVAVATVAGLIGGGGAVVLGRLMQTEGESARFASLLFLHSIERDASRTRAISGASETRKRCVRGREGDMRKMKGVVLSHFCRNTRAHPRIRSILYLNIVAVNQVQI